MGAGAGVVDCPSAGSAGPDDCDGGGPCGGAFPHLL